MLRRRFLLPWKPNASTSNHFHPRGGIYHSAANAETLAARKRILQTQVACSQTRTFMHPIRVMSDAPDGGKGWRGGGDDDDAVQDDPGAAIVITCMCSTTWISRSHATYPAQRKAATRLYAARAHPYLQATADRTG